MNKKLKLFLIGLIVITSVLIPYFIRYDVDNFDSNDIKWFQPFSETTNVIFLSENNEFDSIIFFRPDTIKGSVGQFEQGYYDINTIEVNYKLIKGSYHNFRNQDSLDNTESMFKISRTSYDNVTNKEFKFLGILFDSYDVEKIVKINDRTYRFEANMATYPAINISEGIKSFIFNLDSGVIEFIDIRNVKWKRQ